MSKWLAAALVLANLGAWMWIRWHAEQPGEVEAPPERAEINPEKLRLVSERGVRLVPRPAPPAAPPATAAEPGSAAAAVVCARLGPFATEEAAARAGAVLSERQLAFERHKEERRTVTGYRITLPPFPSRQAAEAKRAELTRLGFRDHAVIQEEGMANALSLGVYSIEANAQRHLQRLAARGVSARLQTLHQTRTVHWLELRLDARTVEELRKQAWGGEAALVTETCPSAPPTAAAP
jgi:hypothetical protein